MKMTMEFAIAKRREKDKKTLKTKGKQILYNQLRRDFNYQNIYGMTINEYIKSLEEEIAQEESK